MFLKVHTTSITSSFRYPHVNVGELPTFDMPPPSTIYGHISAVLGDLLPDSVSQELEFAYIFSYDGKAFDCETLHTTEITGEKSKLTYKGKVYKKNIEITTNVQSRQFLLNCDLKLYLKSDNTDLLDTLKKAFMRPYHPYILGRSQDLATCHKAEFISLTEQKNDIFMHHSLIPFSWRQYITAGEPVLMTSKIDHNNNRQPTFNRYLQLLKRPLMIYDGSPDLIQNIPDSIYVDTSEVKNLNDRNLVRGLYFHKLNG